MPCNICVDPGPGTKEGRFSWVMITRSTRGRYGRYDLDYKGVWDADTR